MKCVKGSEVEERSRCQGGRGGRVMVSKALVKGETETLWKRGKLWGGGTPMDRRWSL